jgi:ornithine carbamoyltransferase
MNLTLSQQAKPSDDVLFQEVGGEAVLLNLASESYFGLDAVGTRIWLLLGEDAKLQHAFEAMLAEYEVDPTVLESDLLALVGKLAEAGLVQVE